MGTSDSTTIVEGAGTQDSIDARVAEIEQGLHNTSSEYDREKLTDRRAKLVGGVAVVKVGGASEVEVSEKKDRVVDALNATKAALGRVLFPEVVALSCGLPATSRPPAAFPSRLLPTTLVLRALLSLVSSRRAPA